MANLADAPQYILGSQLYISGSFTSAAGDLVDPTGVLFKYKLSNGSTTTLTYGVDAALVKDGTGLYHVYFTPGTAGTYYFRWETTGTTTVGAYEGSFTIRSSNF